MERDISDMKNNLGDIGQVIYRLQNQLDNFSKKYKESEDRNEELSEVMVLIRAENDRLVRLMFEKFQNFRKKQKEMQGQQQEMGMLIKQQLQALYEDKEKLKEQINNNIQVHQNQKQGLQREVQRLEVMLMEVEQQKQKEEEEKERLDQTLQEKNNECQLYQKKVQHLESQLVEQQQQQQQRHQDEMAEQLQLKDIQFNKLINEQKQQADSKDKLNKTKIIELENTIKYMGLEVDRLQDMLNESEQENEQLRQKYKDLDKQRNQERQEMLIEFEQVNKKHFESSDLEKRFNAERMGYEQEIMMLRQKILEQEQNINNLKQENNKLNLLQIERMKEIEKWKNERGVGSQDNQEALQKQLEEQRRQLLQTKENLVRMQSERNQLLSTVKGLQQELDNKKEELTQCYDLVQMQKQDQQALEMKHEESRKECNRLNGELKDLEYQQMVNRESLESQANSIQEANNRYQLLQGQFHTKDQEYQQLHQVLKAKIQELDQIKNKYQDGFNIAQQNISLKYSRNFNKNEQY